VNKRLDWWLLVFVAIFMGAFVALMILSPYTGT
jgi:hypothetical protein